MRLRDEAERTQHHGDGMLRCRCGVPRGRVGDGDIVLGGCGDVDVDRTAAAHDEEAKVFCLFHHALGERSMMCDADGNTLENVDHLLFRAGGLAHLGDIAEWLDGKGSRCFGDLEAIRKLTKGGAHELRRDEVVSNDEKLFLRHYREVSFGKSGRGALNDKRLTVELGRISISVMAQL